MTGLLPLALAAVFIIALLPVSWLTPWTSRVQELTYLPLVPLGDAATAARRWLRDDGADLPTRLEIEQLEIDRNNYRRQLHAANNRIRELESMVEELQGLPVTARSSSSRSIPANVVGRAADRLQGPVRINAGTRRGVESGAIAVHQGDALAGRVLVDPGPTSALLLPTYLERNLIDCRLQAGERSIPLQLEPTGGQFISSVDRQVAVSVGDVVRLHDAAWPDAAQGMRLAIVQSVTPRTRNPNRLDLVLDSTADPNRLARVLILVDDAPGTGASE